MAQHGKVVTVVAQPNSPTKTEWVLLSYRVPREPSTPRIAIWRRLKKWGVAQVGDGLVALPHDARTKEHLEWVATMVHEADGEAIVWVATTTKRQSNDLAAKMNAERDQEFDVLIDEIAAEGSPVSQRTIGRLRREYRRIERRDYFRSERRNDARLALGELVASDAEVAAE